MCWIAEKAGDLASVFLNVSVHSSHDLSVSVTSLTVSAAVVPVSSSADCWAAQGGPRSRCPHLKVKGHTQDDRCVSITVTSCLTTFYIQLQAVLTLNPEHAHLSRSWEASCRPGWAPSRTSACGTSPCGGEEDTGSELLLPRRQQLARITESPRTRVGSFYKFPAMWEVFPSWIARTPR